MPKVITNKERIDRLTKELAKLKAEKDSAISYLKKEVRALKASKKYYANRQSNNPTVNLSEVEKLKSKIQLQSDYIEQLKRELSDANHRISLLKSSDEWYIKQDYKMRLYNFYCGLPCDKTLIPFFDPTTLIIRFNPFTGKSLGFEVDKIIEIIKNYPDYKEALQKFEPYKDIWQIEPYSDEGELLYELGKSLLPLYIDYFIGYIY